MPRLIDADFFKAELIKWRDNDHHRKSRSLVERWVRKTGINVLIRALDAFPSVPYEPVRHGRWVYDGESLMGRCSECRQLSSWDGSNYCPNCGTKMDGGNDHD